MGEPGATGDCDWARLEDWPCTVVVPVRFPDDFVVDGQWCKVPPYETTKVVNVKERWRDRPLIDVMCDEFKLTPEYIQQAASAERLLINKVACHADDLLSNGDQITHTYTVSEPHIRSEQVMLIAENEHIVVVEKPSGMPCHPQGGFHRSALTEVLKCSHLKQPTAYMHPVNRLDRGTSGVVLLAKSRKAYMYLSQQLDTMQKVYIAKVRGTFSVSEVRLGIQGKPWSQNSSWLTFNDSTDQLGGWDVECSLPLNLEKHCAGQPLLTKVDVNGGKPSKTLFRTLPGDGSFVLCRPVTGRTHQIRVHLEALGCSIVGDPVYGHHSARLASPEESEAVDEHMCLHAAAYAVRLDADGDVQPSKPILPLVQTLPTPSVAGAALPYQSDVSRKGALVVYRSRIPQWAAPAISSVQHPLVDVAIVGPVVVSGGGCDVAIPGGE